MASLISSSAIATVTRATPAQASMVAPFAGLKSTSAFPVTRKLNNDITSISSNGGRVQCMKVWPPLGLLKFETLSYLPPLTQTQLAKEVDYLLRSGWVPCLEFELEIDRHFLSDPDPPLLPAFFKRLAEKWRCGHPNIVQALTGFFTSPSSNEVHGCVYREHHHSPGYYDGRYWTMWKLPMYGCTDSSQVLKEVEECKKEYPNAFVRIIGFDNKRQVQCISFIASKPDA